MTSAKDDSAAPSESEPSAEASSTVGVGTFAGRLEVFRQPQAESPSGIDGEEREADRLLLAKYSPPGVLVNADLNIIQFRGDTGPYLATAPGKPSLSLLKMARKGLLVGLRSAVQKAIRSGLAVREEGLYVKANGKTREVNLEVLPIRAGAPSDGSLLVLFEEATAARGRKQTGVLKTGARVQPNGEETEREVKRLTHELAATRRYLRSLIKQHETANEELQCANEEVQSANEELQSVNQELQISEEELHLNNEQLITVNEELVHRNELLAVVNSDLANFLASTHLALVMVGPDLRLRRFTSHAERLLNLIAGDVDRPISDLRLPLNVTDLTQRLKTVIESAVAQELEVQDQNGDWYSMRLCPYRTPNNKVDGAVVVIVETQVAIQESEQRFRALANSAPVLIWVNGVEECEFVNLTCRDYLGVGERDGIRWDWAKFVHPDDRDSFRRIYHEAFAKRALFDVKFRLRRADGEYRWVSAVGVPRLTEAGELLGYVASAHDIDELMRVQEALQRSEKSLATELTAMSKLQEVSSRLIQARDPTPFLTEIVDAAIAITGADTGTIQLLDRATDSLRVAASRGLERPFLEFFANVRDDPAACGTAMKRGERVVVEDVTRSEIFAGSPALDVLLAAGVRAVQSTLLIGRSGTLVGMLSTHYRRPRRPSDRELRLLDLLARQAADAIERTQIEEARLEAANRSEQLLNVTSAGVYTVDTKGVIVYFNRQAAEFWGRSPGPGDTYEQFWPTACRKNASDPSRPPDPTPIKNALSLGTSIRGKEQVITRPNGSTLPVQMNVDPIRDADGRISGAIAVFYDVTQLKRILTADRLKDQFVAMLAHELRNPLAALSLTVGLMRRRRETGTAGDDHLRVIDRQVANLTGLVDDLLDVTRMNLGKIRLQKAVIALSTVVRSAIESVRPDLEAKNHKLSVDLSPEPVYVEGDSARLTQALMNLLDNANKYTDTGGQIAVTLAADHAQAVMRVKDTGIGIRPEMLPLVFDLFAQEEGDVERSRGGLGLGLFMVAKIAELHDGRVEAYSAGPGTGAEFAIRLPRLSQAEVDRSMARETTEKTSPILRALRILVVEDNLDVADPLAELLRCDGHEVRLESDGPAAVAAVDAFRPEIVLLDIMLPGMDGYEVARYIRQQSGSANPGIVGLSGFTHEDARRRARDAGFDELLAKPVDMEVLARTLARLVARKP